jgi:hypothetical protein
MIEAAAKTPAAVHSSKELVQEYVLHVAKGWAAWVEEAPVSPVVSSEVRSSVADKQGKRPA